MLIYLITYLYEHLSKFSILRCRRFLTATVAVNDRGDRLRLRITTEDVLASSEQNVWKKKIQRSTTYKFRNTS